MDYSVLVAEGFLAEALSRNEAFVELACAEQDMKIDRTVDVAAVAVGVVVDELVVAVRADLLLGPGRGTGVRLTYPCFAAGALAYLLHGFSTRGVTVA